jgi:alkanesulfonate monooxygenase SsuD/methylene tetrahydromethanopterin reductase-like flavin-dependent oxidoreductase (luciferase family)
VTGFLRPEPPPPIIVAGFGPKMAYLAGHAADGINTPDGRALSHLLEVARSAHAESGRDPSSFLVTVSSDLGPASLDRLASLGVHRAIGFVRSPSADQIRLLASQKS